MAKLKKYLTTVTITKTVTRTIHAFTKPSAIKALKDQLKRKPPRFVGIDFTESEASEIETIY